jgi:NADPH:quinone reductase-like Zn-dependent oxidoreductase
MRAVRLRKPAGPEGLVLEEIADPRPSAGEALVRVHAAGITRDELSWPVDRLPATPSYELSGVVAEVASDVEGVTPGEEVFSLTGFERDGAAAEYAVVPAAVLAPKPRTLGHLESAALPLAGLTAWQALFDHGRLTEGQSLLVHGAAGGVGHLAVQLARWRGARVVSTFEEAVDPVDVVLDTAGGDRLGRSPEVLTKGGRIVSVAEEPPREGWDDPQIDAVYFIVEPSREQLTELAKLVDAGELRPVIDQVFPLEEARAAFARSLARGKRGKVVLAVAGD